MSDIPTEDNARRRKRDHDRKWIAAKRASMTPEERAERRRAHDAAYRERHREQRREYDREYYRSRR